MIQVFVNKNKTGDVYAFRIKDHGRSIVCAAVSILALNAVNSIEAFTSLTEKDYRHRHKKGYFFFEIPAHKNNTDNKEAALLLNSFLLGIEGIAESYPEDIELKEAEKC